MGLEGKVAFVTGGGSGIGRASAGLLAAEGARVAVVDLDRERVEEAARQIGAAGGEAIGLEADVSDAAQVERAVNAAAEKWGRIDIVFANAGVNGVWAPLEKLRPEEWAKTVAINLNGTFHTLHYALPHLRKRGGSVIITSSVNGTRIFTNVGAAAYASTKAAQVALGKMAALELSPEGIRVNVICPGAIETNIGESTEQRDVKEAGPPEVRREMGPPLRGGEPGTAMHVAHLVRFLASDDSELISGAVIFIDGAESLLQG